MKQSVSLSGGKDSTAMLLLMLERGEPIERIIFFDWGMEFPEIYAHLEKLEAYIGRKIIRLYPPNSWEYFAFDYVKKKGIEKGSKGYGLPHRKSRWCTRIKTDAIRKISKGEIQVVGLASDEVRRFKSRYSPLFGYYDTNFRYPLAEWGISERDALKICYSRGFDFGGIYHKGFKRVSCWCCPFQGDRLMKMYYPDLLNKTLYFRERQKTRLEILGVKWKGVEG